MYIWKYSTTKHYHKVQVVSKHLVKPKDHKETTKLFATPKYDTIFVNHERLYPLKIRTERDRYEPYRGVM